MHLGFGELLLIFLVILLIFGSSKLPQLGDALGRGIKNFKKATTEEPIDVTPKKLEGRRRWSEAPRRRSSSHASPFRWARSNRAWTRTSLASVASALISRKSCAASSDSACTARTGGL